MKTIEVILNHPEVAGNQSELARLLGKKQQLVNYWAKEAKSDMPLDVALIAAEYLKIKPSELSPVFKRAIELEAA